MKTDVMILLTSGRSVSGTFDHGDQRLSDALNGSLASVLRLANARVGRFGGPSANAAVALAIVPKIHTALVIAHGESERSKDKRIYAYVPKQPCELFVLVAGVHIRGYAHAATDLDAGELHRQLSEPADRFLVLTEAWLASDVEGTTEQPLGVAMLNARHIQFAGKMPVTPAADPRPQLVMA